jgi:hypothetical protein
MPAALTSLALLLGLLAAGCRTAPRPMDRKEVPHAVEQAKSALSSGQSERALDLMRSAAVTTGLPTATRDEVQTLLEQAAARRIDELSAPGQDPEDLADMIELDLPRQIAVTAGLRAARGLFQEEEALDAYKLLKRLDVKFPLHHERAAAGDLLVEIGLWLVVHGTGWLGIGHSTSDAQEVLEYVILRHPSASRCDEAYETLAQIYEDDREWHLAIERLEFLVLNHPDSPRRPRAQAHVPHLRLRALRSPEYDRSELLAAQRELESWLKDYSGHELERQVRIDLGDCLRRLCDSDLLVADFYKRIHQPFGERFHLERAVEEARSAGDQQRVADAEKRLRHLPPRAPEAQS